MRDDVGLAAGTDASRPRSSWVGGDRLLIWAPLLCAAAYAIAVLANLHTLIAAVYVDSDAALAPVLGEAIGHIASGSFVSLGNHAWYEEWLFLTLTRDLPAHRQLWEIAPLLWSLAGLAVLGACIRGIAGSRAAALCLAALVCVGPFGRFCFLAINWHSLSAVHTVLACAVLLWLYARIERLKTALLLASAVALGGLCALPTASDSLFVAWAMIPLLVTSVVAARHATPAARRRLTLFVALVCAVTALGALLIAAAMRHAGITARALPISVATPSAIPHNVALLLESFTYLAGGRLGLSSASPLAIVQLLSALLALLALSVALNEARLLGTRVRGDGEALRRLLGSFWATSLILSLLVFVLSTAPKDALSGRYLLAAYLATGTLLALAATRSARARKLIAAGVCLFAFLATYQLLRRPFTAMRTPGVSVRLPGPQTAAALERFAREEHAYLAYAGYWDAEELTWNTGFRVLVRPVRPCSPHGGALCYPQLGDVSSWYVPHASMRSILLVDRPGISYDIVRRRDPELGRPLASRRVGYLQAYVYGYDIASRLHDPRCDFSWAHPC